LGLNRTDLLQRLRAPRTLLGRFGAAFWHRRGITMKKLAVFAALAALAVTSGCMHYNVKVGKGGSGATQTFWQHHFVFGLIGDGNVDVASICNGSTDATVKIERTFVDGCLGGILFAGALWQPSTVTVQCGEKTAEVAIDEATAKKIVASPEFLDVVNEVAPDRMQDAVVAQQQLATAAY
jgi:hypothetical protein